MEQVALSRETQRLFTELKRLREQTDIFAASNEPRHPEFAKVSALVTEVALSATEDLGAHLGLSGGASVTAELLEGPDRGGGARPMSLFVTANSPCARRYYLLDEDTGVLYYLYSKKVPCLELKHHPGG